MEINSTYGLKKDFSFRGEQFYNIPLTWRLGICRIELVKIRVAQWKPKADRSGQAIFYFDVKTDQEAQEILSKIKDYNFKKIENFFEKIYLRDKGIAKNTGETWNHIEKVWTPEIREKFKTLY